MALNTEGESSKLLGEKLNDFGKILKVQEASMRSKATVNKPKFRGTVIQLGNFKLELFLQDNRNTKTAF